MPELKYKKSWLALYAPTKSTLSKYGLTVDDWLEMARSQNWQCPICEEPFGIRALAIDHEHVRGFKARKRRLKSGKRRASKDVRVMTPAERRKHVRGILHAWCNRFVRSWLTLSRAASILRYLEQHERRKAAPDRDAG